MTVRDTILLLVDPVLQIDPEVVLPQEMESRERFIMFLGAIPF
jgi:hypothetical protein